ncbi:MAG: response regulator [Paracoccaceae bacterium]
MNVLIVENRRELRQVWCNHLARQGAIVRMASNQDQAIEAILEQFPDIIVLNLVLEDGGALAISDFASYRAPQAQVIFVTDTSFFSDGSIFSLSPNACAFVQTDTPPEDLAAIVEHYAN